MHCGLVRAEARICVISGMKREMSDWYILCVNLSVKEHPGALDNLLV